MRISHLMLPLMVPVLGLTTPLLAQNSSSITSNGDNQHAQVSQQSALSSSVEITQIGSSNISRVTQSGSDNDVELVTDGVLQEQNINQAGDGMNGAHLVVFGSANTADIGQYSSAGGINEISLLQDGSNNQAQLQQQATAAGLNRIDLIQAGNDNLALLSQNGGDNNINLTQNGDANQADVTQNGSGLGFTLTQEGGAQVIVTQTSPGG